MGDPSLENFYSEISSTYTPGNSSVFNSIIKLSLTHEVYKGHFPQIPVTPGVALVWIVKDILMDKFQKKMVLSTGDNIKFLALINPTEIADFQIDFVVKPLNNGFDVSANFMNNGKAFTKFKGKFKIVL
jgi:3-hydroxyacyl-[acyl-carrier-protein] dehydratase